MIPSFLVQSFTTSLVPEISKLYTLKDYKSIKSKLFKCILIIIIFGFIINTFVFINAKYLLKLIFNTTKGTEYIKVLSFVFVLHNLEGPLSSCLTALNRPKDAFICSSIGIIAKLLAIVIIGLLKVGIYNLIIGEILDITITIYLYYKSLRKILS
jgi:stage V sporulation protein B